MKIFLSHRVFQVRTCQIFLILMKFKKKLRVTANVISNGQEMNKNNKENASEAEYASVEDP